MPDLSWIRSDLALGGRLAPDAAVLLAKVLKFTAVVDLRAEEGDDPLELHHYKLDYLHLPTPELQPISQVGLVLGVSWIRERLATGGRVLVHCEHGLRRSPILACAILVAEGSTALEAVRSVKAVRRLMSPSPDQLHALLAFSASLRLLPGVDQDPSRWEELTAVAYGHERTQVR